MEALLYGFQSIAETIDVNYSDVIPGLIGLIPRININNVQLADTVMFTIGEKCSISEEKNLNISFFITVCLPLRCSPSTRCFGRVAGGPPGDAQQRPAVGAAGPREPGPLRVICLHAQEDLPGVQARPGAVCIQHSSRVPGIHGLYSDLTRGSYDLSHLPSAVHSVGDADFLCHVPLD